MVSWIAFAVFAQFLSAISVVVDKHVVVRAAHIGQPLVYAFYVSLLSGFVVVLLPFGLVSLPSATLLAIAFVDALFFLASIFFLYSALKHARASDVAPVVGAVSALTTLMVAPWWISGEITALLFVPILLLAGGTALISRFHFSRETFRYVMFSGVSFGITAFFFKLIFIETSFFDGFFWSRMMNVAVALGLLCIPRVRRIIFHGGRHASHKAKFLVVGNKILAGSAAILTAYAINLGSVTVVNALSGLQFVFLFLFALLFTKYMPGATPFNPKARGFWHAALGVLCIVSGLALIYVLHLV